VDLYKAIRELYAERKRLDEVIASLEDFQRRAEEMLPLDLKKRRGRKSMDARARQEVSQRMKQYWASRRKSAGGSSGGENSTS